MGKDPTLRRARTSLWWPEINKQLMQFIDTCEVCNAFRLPTKLQTQVKSWVWYFWVDQGTLSGYSCLLCTCHCLAPGVEPGPGKARVCVGESFSTFMKSSDFSQQIAETARKRAQDSNHLWLERYGYVEVLFLLPIKWKLRKYNE